ncbi:bridging integrator 3-like [Amphiura filiformis]|uniref:bridging integrator 3-like n=1 Tax=Amphiura filiformis TaxID=82378 RepID=UPI003B21974F
MSLPWRKIALFGRLTSPKKVTMPQIDEKEFEKETNKIEVLDEATKRLYKDMKKCIDAMGTLSRTQCRIGHNVAASPVMNTEDSLKPLELISRCIGKVEELTTELNGNSSVTMVDPMKKFSTIFPSIYLALKKREQALQEFGRCTAKVQKYEDKERTGQNLAKLEASKKALDTAQEVYEKQHQELMDAMPQFFEGRIDYFQPCFEALIKSQIAYYTECFKIYAELAAQLEPKETIQTDDDFEMDLHQRLCDIRALSIVVDD